jgi:hypothetical protein
MVFARHEKKDKKRKEKRIRIPQARDLLVSPQMKRENNKLDRTPAAMNHSEPIYTLNSAC